MIGDDDGARADWSRTLELAESDVMIAHASDRWGMCLYTFGEAAEAAETLAKNLELQAPMARLENSMWVVRLHLRAGDLAAAAEAFDGDITAPTADEDSYSPGLRDGVVAQLLAVHGDAELARDRLASARAAIAEISMPVTLAELAIDAAVVERLLGDHAASERAADAARAAYLTKGATAMAAHVDRWVRNADVLRG